MNDKDLLEQIIQEYDDVALHYESFLLASQGAIRPGEKRKHVYDKRYSGTKEFIAWTTKIRYFIERSPIAGSKDASDIVVCINGFRGFGEETKLKKLYNMLNALFENWALVSQPIQKTNSPIERGRRLGAISPKFELICKDGGGSNRVFSLKNVSSVIVSNITAESFDLVQVGNSRENVMPWDLQMPTSLGSNETREFSIDNPVFEQRRVGYKEFRFMFTVEDEHSNKYCCIARKKVDNPYDKRYMLGQWSIQTECVGFQEGKTNNKERQETIVYNSINIGGNAQNIQIQQGSDNSSQMQSTNVGFDFDAAQKILDEIIKFQPMFEEEFGEKSQELVDAIYEAKVAIAAKDQSKLKNAWSWIKNVAANATGGMIAAGITALLSKVVF